MADYVNSVKSAIQAEQSKGNWFSNAWNSVKNWFGNTFNTVNGAPSSLTNDNTLLDELGEWAHNALTGERDYNRQKELMEQEMAYNASEAQKVRDYEERMSNTSYQRAVDDLIKAGLNPAVAMSIGGASTPHVSSASIGSHSVQRSGDQFTSLLSSMFGVFGNLINSSIRAKQVENQKEFNDKMYELRRDIFHSSKSSNSYKYSFDYTDNYLKKINKTMINSSKVLENELDELKRFVNFL